MSAKTRYKIGVIGASGYTGAHKWTVSQATGRPVMLSSSVVARVVGELLELG